MKLVVQILLVIVLLFVLLMEFAATVGILIRILIIAAIVAGIAAYLQHAAARRKPANTLDKRAHTKAEQAAEKRLKELERNVNQ